MSAEEWRPVPGYGGAYEVSDQGRVRSVDRVQMSRANFTMRFYGRPMKPCATGGGHLRVQLASFGVRRNEWVHGLVAAAFIGERPDGLVVRHLDGNPTNNLVSNLAYGTHSQNVLDSVAHGTHNEARKTHCKHGHEFIPSNTRIVRRGARECIECRRIRNARITARRKSARLGVAA